MEAVTIRQNRSNYWTAAGVLLAGGLLICAGVGMIASWPIEATFEWMLLPILFVGALLMGGTHLFWLISPRHTILTVTADEIRIEHQPAFRWVTRTFSAPDVVEITYSGESGSFLKTRDGKVYYLSDILMMQRSAIFSAIAARHPHIVLKGED